MTKIDSAAAMAAAEQTESADLTLKELVAAYYARNPIAGDRERLRKWLDALGTASAWGVQQEQLEVAGQALLAHGYAAASVNKDWGAIGTVYKWAKQQRLAPRGFTSPTVGIRRFTASIRRVEISEAEIAAIKAGSLASRSPGFGAFVHCLVDSGARRGEVLERHWRDLDSELGTLTAPMTKNGTPRVLFLRPETLGLLARLGGGKPNPDALIFPGKYTDTPRDYRRPWRLLTRDVGRPDLRLHDLRHAAAARLLRAGNTVGVAAQILGHSPEILARRYGHLETEALRQAQERAWT